MSLCDDIDIPEVFEDREAIKLFLYEYNYMNQRKGRITQSSNLMLVMVCVDRNCSFIFKASRSKENVFTRRQFSAHSCMAQQSCVKSKLLARHISLLESTISSITPANCVSHLRTSCGVDANYNQAYASLQLVRQNKIKFEQQSYGMIKSWLEQLMLIQPGTFTAYEEKNPDSANTEFEYCALIPAMSSNALQHCLPIITLDACHTKGKYKGIIMIATAITGEDKSLILGYRIAPTENEKYWCKFVNLLNNALTLSSITDLVIISDRDKGLQIAVETVLPNAAHSYCVAHIERNLTSRFRRSCPHIWAASKAVTKNEFNQRINQLILEKGTAVGEYLRNIPTTNWARAYFPVPRYGHVTSNVAESVNASIKQLRKNAPLEILVGISRMINGVILKKSTEFSTFSDQELPKKYQLLLEETIERSKYLTFCQLPNSNLFEVQHDISSTCMRIIDIQQGICSCMDPKEYGFPCVHACALVRANIVSKENFISNKRLVGALKQVYGGYVAMVDLEQLEQGAVNGAAEQRRRGRPRSNERIRARSEIAIRRRKTCSMCAQHGHDKRKCPRNPSNGAQGNQGVE